MELTPGKIFLADQRGLAETDSLRRYSTFSFEKFVGEQNQPIERLFICNDESIAAGKMIFFLSRQDSYQIFFPVAGSLDIVQSGKEFTVDNGQIQILNVGKGEVLEISNPYAKETINYIQIGLTTDLFLLKPSEMLFRFDFGQEKNKLIEIVNHTKLPFKFSAGIFSERQKVVYQLQKTSNNLFCFVIDGKFEIQGSLMHSRDGLALGDQKQVEITGVSDNAILFAIEQNPIF